MTKRRSIDELINIFRKVHGDKYDYSLVSTTKTKQKVKIICPIHGIFEQTVSGHLRGNNCKKCSSSKHSENMTKSKECFIKKAKETHKNKYDYSLVNYKHSHKKVKIICPIHGIFEQTPNSHLQKSGCPECFKQRQTKNIFDFKNISNNVHGSKYDYSLVDYKTSKQKVKIICPVHGIFEQRPDNHIQGQGCPNCIPKSYTSKSEIELREWIQDFIEIKSNVRDIISPYEIDIVIPSKKLAIEFDGLYWHGEQQGKDKFYHLKKLQRCEEIGYKLIHIWSNEWEFKTDIVKSIILNMLNLTKNIIHGRKCNIKSIDVLTAKNFYNNNHIQGFKGGRHKGLFYKKDLVSMMTIDRKGELQRFANKKFTRVHGAFSKLLKSYDIKKDI